MRKNRITDEEQKSAEIMITPLADVSFTILITLMVLTPVIILSSRLHVNLPEATTVEPPTEKNITITITSEHEISINNELVTTEQLAKVLQKTIRNNPNDLILIRTDKELETGMVMNVIALAKKLGARSISIATVQR
ncbi:biopolymer transporter ExbD [candidate division WOR-3 bacterium]|nr:biopolymer transporter ExbD [candidate division WOR-3 bacterium]